jgi:hypothetical protein
MKLNIGAGFTVFPFGIFHFDMAAASNAGNKYHGRRENRVAPISAISSSEFRRRLPLILKSFKFIQLPPLFKIPH